MIIMKKEYIQPNVKEIKVSTIDMLAGSPNGPQDVVTEEPQLSKEDQDGGPFGW